MKKKCDDCHSTNIIENIRTGDVICATCGSILAQRIIDDRPEWVNYLQEGKKTEKGRVQKIIPLSQLFSSEKKTRYEKKVLNIYYEIRSVADRLMIFSLIKPLLDNYTTILVNTKNIKIQYVKEFATGMLYLICMQLGVAYTREDLVQMMGADKSKMMIVIRQVYKIYKKIYHLSENYYINLLRRFCNELNISIKDTGRIEQIFERLKFTANSITPLNLIATAILLDKPDLDLGSISEKIGISVGVIKSNLKKYSGMKFDHK